MNNLASVLGLACVNESFRSKLLDEGGRVEERLPILLSKGERLTLDYLIGTEARKKQLADALKKLGDLVEGDVRPKGPCQTPPYCCTPDKVFQ